MNTNITEDEAQRQLANIGSTRYERLWRSVILITAMISLVPLIIMTVVNFHQDKKAFQSEINYNISQILSTTKRALQFALEEHQSALSLIINEHSFEELSSDKGLAFTFRNLKDAFSGFIDLGLIDSKGNQSFYNGPYNLKGENYKDQSWFYEVSMRGVYISDIFLGHRKFPHFIIAYKRYKEDGDYYVLRATIDMEMLNRQIFTTDFSRTIDAFIINKQGILQTVSHQYGKILEKCPITVPPYPGDREVIEQYKENGKSFILGYVFIKQSPFILLVTSELKYTLKHWFSSRIELVWFLVICIIVVMLVIVSRANYLVKQIRSADLKRAKLYHNFEYTNKMVTIGRMAAGVAHEINNPLAIINEKAGLLKDIVTFTDDLTHKDKILGSVESILKSVDRCSIVTRRLLGFARRLDPKKEMIDLEILLKEVLGFLSKEASHRNIDVRMNVDDGISAIESDRGQLQQVFLNIVNNAFAAVDDGGRIEISIQNYNDNRIAVSFRDNGAGISEENLKHIFEPFFSTKGELGTGLGLSITNDIVEKLGGHINVESKVGEGTSFTIDLPK